MAWRRTRRPQPGTTAGGATRECERPVRAGQALRRGPRGAQGRRAAAQLFQQAAAQGRVNAYSQLGDLYASGDGDGIGQDYAAALRWYDEAARNGDPRGFTSSGTRTSRAGRKSRSRARPDVVQPRLRQGYEQAAARIERLASQLGPEQARAGRRPPSGAMAGRRNSSP